MKAFSPEISNLQFLIVDDFPSIRVMLSASLKKLGVTKIIQAPGGNEGFKIIQENFAKPNQIQFVITDFNMPTGKGIDLIRQVRDVDGFAKLPIMLLTSQDELEVVLECVQAGANDYMIKPWKDEELAKKITDIWTRNK